MSYKRYTPDDPPPAQGRNDGISQTLMRLLKRMLSGGRGLIIAIAIGGWWFLSKTFEAGQQRSAFAALVDSVVMGTRGSGQAPDAADVANWFKGHVLPDRMELYAIRALANRIGSEQLTTACTPVPRVAARTEASLMFDAIRALQAQAAQPRAITERLQSRMLDLLARRPVRPLTRFELRNLDLRGADLRGLALDSATFEGSCLAGAALDESSLRRADFRNATLDSATFVSAQLDSASFVGARGARVHFDRATATMADFSEAQLPGADFIHAHLECALFGNAVLDSASLAFADASWAYFGGTSLLGVQRWQEMTGLSNANFASPLVADDPFVAGATTQGAAPQDVDAEQWVRNRDRQRAEGGACAPPAFERHQ